MSEDIKLSKVEILIQQKKFAEAENVLRDLLIGDADNVHFLTLLCEVYLQQDKLEAAHSIIDNAIGLSPDYDYLYYMKSRIAIQQEKLSDAERYVQQAIAIDPYDADYFALLAHIQLARKQFETALQTANQALEINPENLLALNTRSTALNKLDRSEESFETIEGALREDPNNAYTHANYGWTLLEKGNHKKALEHFKEALKNEPDSEYAQAGMLEAIKATNPVYRAFLKYSFWMNNLNAKYQWAVIIGFYVGFRALRALAKSNEALEPYLTPLIIGLAILAFSSWIITPVSNLFLRFNKYGKVLLSKKEKISSNFVAVSFVAFLSGSILTFSLSDERFLTIAIFGFAMMVPLGIMFSPSKYKNILLIYTIGMAAVGLSGIASAFVTGQLYSMFALVFVMGFVAFQWLANFLIIKEDNR
jgi:tetratricopeptide (TPR) repeat protein